MTVSLYEIADRAVAWLDAENGTSREELGLRLMKVMEEAGEVSTAWIGYVGQNPRKGCTHTLDDVIGELADVVLTALVAIRSLGVDPEDAMDAIVEKISARLAGAS